MPQDTMGVGHWPTTVAHHGGKTTFSGVARAGKALSGWAGDHHQLGRGGRHPGTRLQIATPCSPQCALPRSGVPSMHRLHTRPITRRSAPRQKGQGTPEGDGRGGREGKV